MQKVILIAVLAIGTALPAQVLQFADLNIRDFAKLDRSKTAVIIPGAILEEHGPYLPSGTDGIFNAKLSADLATAIASRPGWTALVMPTIPLGAGAANEIARNTLFQEVVQSRHPRCVQFLWILAISLDSKDSAGLLCCRDRAIPPTIVCLIRQPATFTTPTVARW